MLKWPEYYWIKSYVTIRNVCWLQTRADPSLPSHHCRSSDLRWNFFYFFFQQFSIWNGTQHLWRVTLFFKRMVYLKYLTGRPALLCVCKGFCIYVSSARDGVSFTELKKKDRSSSGHVSFWWLFWHSSSWRRCFRSVFYFALTFIL